jgi:hypothetical protein
MEPVMTDVYSIPNTIKPNPHYLEEIKKALCKKLTALGLVGFEDDLLVQIGSRYLDDTQTHQETTLTLGITPAFLDTTTREQRAEVVQLFSDIQGRVEGSCFREGYRRIYGVRCPVSVSEQPLKGVLGDVFDNRSLRDLTFFVPRENLGMPNIPTPDRGRSVSFIQREASRADSASASVVR